jgi:hypothetical protein
MIISSILIVAQIAITIIKLNMLKNMKLEFDTREDYVEQIKKYQLWGFSVKYEIHGTKNADG